MFCDKTALLKSDKRDNNRTATLFNSKTKVFKMVTRYALNETFNHFIGITSLEKQW